MKTQNIFNNAFSIIFYASMHIINCPFPLTKIWAMENLVTKNLKIILNLITNQVILWHFHFYRKNESYYETG